MEYFLMVLLTCLIAWPIGVVVGWFGARWMDRHYPKQVQPNVVRGCVYCLRDEGKPHSSWCSRAGTVPIGGDR